MIPECMYDYRFEIEEAEVICNCSECGEEIYEGDTHYEIGPECYCEECMENVFRRI